MTGPVTPRAGETTLRNIERATGELTTAANRAIDERLTWYRDLPADERSWVGLIAQAGIASFVRWCRSPDHIAHLTVDVFGAAPRELTRSITLAQTVDLVRCVVQTVEEHAVDLAAPGDEVALARAVLQYAREVAFATAQVYANAAESRGAWDARLESLVVDAVLRGEADDEMVSRATALGWGELGPVAVVVGRTLRTTSDGGVAAVRQAATRHRLEALITVQGRRLVVVLGGAVLGRDGDAALATMATAFGPGPVVVGPTVPRLFAAGRSARAALSGLRAAPAWGDAPRPVHADDLLPERLLLGDVPARHLLIDRVHRPLEAAGASLLDTASAYLAVGRSVEGTARRLFVHSNTVRYRLGRIADVTGYDLGHPREAHVVHCALMVGALAAAEEAWRPRPAVDGC